MKTHLILPSGVSSIDELLEGGLHPGDITHVFGMAAAGKTTFGLLFVRSAVRQGFHTIYVNTEGTTPIERLEQLIGKEYAHIKDLVNIVGPKTFEEQGMLIDDLEMYLKSNTVLIVIDTLTRLYRTVLVDRDVNYAAHRELNRQMGVLKGLAVHDHVTVLVLNQVRAAMESKHEFEPVAKNILDYWADSVIRINIGHQVGERIVENLGSGVAHSRATVMLTTNGMMELSATEKQ